MAKPTREWCKQERTFLEEDTTKKRVRCKDCGRLLVVNTCGWDDDINVGKQFIGPHKGKYE